MTLNEYDAWRRQSLAEEEVDVQMREHVLMDDIEKLDALLRRKDLSGIFMAGGLADPDSVCSCIRSMTSLLVLPQLSGLVFDDLAVAWIMTLRPSRVVVTYGGPPQTFCPWRVTVHLDTDDTIRKIVQEVYMPFGPVSRITELTQRRRQELNAVREKEQKRLNETMPED